MFPNVKASEQSALLGVVSPSSQAAGALNTGWISAALFNKFLAIGLFGVFGTSGSPAVDATVDIKIRQATSSAGAGAKDITGAAITTVAKTGGDNKQVLINLDASQLDVANGFDYIEAIMTITGGNSLTALALLGFNPRFPPGSDSNAASVVQVVN